MMNSGRRTYRHTVNELILSNSALLNVFNLSTDGGYYFDSIEVAINGCQNAFTAILDRAGILPATAETLSPRINPVEFTENEESFLEIEVGDLDIAGEPIPGNMVFRFKKTNHGLRLINIQASNEQLYQACLWERLPEGFTYEEYQAILDNILELEDKREALEEESKNIPEDIFKEIERNKDKLERVHFQDLQGRGQRVTRASDEEYQAAGEELRKQLSMTEENAQDSLLAQKSQQVLEKIEQNQVVNIMAGYQEVFMNDFPGVHELELEDDEEKADNVSDNFDDLKELAIRLVDIGSPDETLVKILVGVDSIDEKTMNDPAVQITNQILPIGDQFTRYKKACAHLQREWKKVKHQQTQSTTVEHTRILRATTQLLQRPTHAPTIAKYKSLTDKAKEKGPSKLRSKMLGALGVVLIGVSVTLACASFGAFSLGSAIGIKIGVTLLSQSIATASSVPGIGFTSYAVAEGRKQNLADKMQEVTKQQKPSMVSNIMSMFRKPKAKDNVQNTDRLSSRSGASERKNNS